MKSSLAHLPPHRQEQLRAITELVQKEPAVSMLILFGSFARGDWVADYQTGYRSDLDLAVVVETEPSARDEARWQEVERQARALSGDAQVTLIVHDLKSFNHEIRMGQFFFSDIVNEGVGSGGQGAADVDHLGRWAFGAALAPDAEDHAGDVLAAGVLAARVLAEAGGAPSVGNEGPSGGVGALEKAALPIGVHEVEGQHRAVHDSAVTDAPTLGNLVSGPRGIPGQIPLVDLAAAHAATSEEEGAK